MILLFYEKFLQNHNNYKENALQKMKQKRKQVSETTLLIVTYMLCHIISDLLLSMI